MEINVGDNVKIKRGSRPTPLSKYESKIKTINSIPYPIQSDIDTNSIFLNKCKKYFRIDLNFKFVPSIKGDLLITSSCDIGNVVILDFQEAFIDDKFFNLEVSKQISKSYLKYWLIKNKNDISNLGYGTTIKVLYIEPFKQYLKTKFLPALKIQQSKEGTYRYYNCSSNVSFIDNYNEYSNNDDLLIITTRGTITSHIIPRNTYFYATNNLMIFKGEGIHCFDYWFKNNKKSIISGTSIPMITKKDLNFLNFAYDKNIEELLQKINNLIFFFEKIKNIISIIIKKLIEIYIE